MKPEDPNYVERFEFFMNGWEMANAYSEVKTIRKIREDVSKLRRRLLQQEMRKQTTQMRTS